jgi:hypothetical protein
MTTWNNALNDRNPVYKLYDFKKSDNTKELLAVSNNQLLKEVSGNLIGTFGTLTTNNVKFITYKDRSINDVVLIADGGSLKTYNSGTMTVSSVTPHTPTTGETTDPGLNDLANLTNFRTFALKKDRIFAAAHPTIKNRVHFSFFDPILGYAVYDYFPAIYFFDVATEENDAIVELKVFRNQLIIFCQNSVWTLKGDGANLVDYELIKLNVPKGCISRDSVQEVGNNLFFLADDHVYSLFATDQEYISAQIMSDKVLPVLKSVGLSDKALATSIFYDNKYYLSFPSGLTLVYDVTLESWTRYTGIQANSFIVRDNLLYFSNNEGVIYRFNENVFNDNGDPISFEMKTKLIDFDYPVHMKKFRKSWIISKEWDNFNSSYDLDFIIDQFDINTNNDLTGNVGQGSSGIWDTSSWDKATWDTAETTQRELKISKKGKDIQFKITNDKVDEPLTIYGIVLEYQLKKPKR